MRTDVLVIEREQLCAGVATCESDAECGLRNDAQENPLFCADSETFLGNEGRGRFCIQSSEP